MKVGGNQSAREYFVKHGGNSYLQTNADAKAKYTSRVAVSYKDELKRRVSKDAIKYPEEVVVEQAKDSVALNDSNNSSKDDFFANWEKPLIEQVTPPISRSSTPSNSASTKPVVKPQARSTKTVSSSSILAKRNTARGAGIGGRKTNIANKKKFAAKKLTVEDIDFDEAERKAKEEEAETVKLGYNPAESKTSTVSQKSETNDTFSSFAPNSSSKVAPKKEADVTKSFARLGFGQTAGSAVPESKTSRKPAVEYTGTVAAKYGTQRAISSDEFFGRNTYDSAAQAEAKSRLQAFDGATSISSSSYFGEDEDANGRGRSGTSGSADLAQFQDAARDFAGKFSGTADEDLQVLKDVLEQGASKLGDIMRDILR